jgi:TPR repeat protein
VPQDLDEALRIFKRAAAKGDADAAPKVAELAAKVAELAADCDDSIRIPS